MIRGIDTTFLIQVEIADTPQHKAARELLERFISKGEKLGLTQQVLAEFVHIVTDPKRFQSPLSIDRALDRALDWWEAKEVEQVIPTVNITRVTFDLMRKYSLGRKRILDTQLAATFLEAGISSIVSSNDRDFRIYESFNVLVPGS